MVEKNTVSVYGFGSMVITTPFSEMTAIESNLIPCVLGGVSYGVSNCEGRWWNEKRVVLLCGNGRCGKKVIQYFQ